MSVARPARRLPALLGVVALAVPLAVAGGPPAGAAPVGRVASTVAEACDSTTSTLIDQTPSALSQLGADQVRTLATGRGIVVAVVDSGVDAGNVHFQGGVVLPGVDLTGPGDGRTDLSGHGTAIAGEIAAQLVPGSGVVGLAPDARILPVRVYVNDPQNGAAGTDGSGADTSGGSTGGGGPTVAGITAGIITAANLGAKIINVSLSSTTDDPALASAVQYATARGSLVIASAGNRRTSDDKTNAPHYPGAYPDALAVAAADRTGQVTIDSIHGSYVDVAAPGADILTTHLALGDCQLATDYASTSYATAYVSAAAALIAQAHPDETPAQWRYRLEATALRVRPDTRDDYAGWGVIQPYEALTLVSDGSLVGPPDPAATASSTPTPAQRAIDPVAARAVDTTDRDQTLWITLGGIVLVLLLALLALLRRDRGARPVRPEEAQRRRPPAGVR